MGGGRSSFCCFASSGKGKSSILWQLRPTCAANANRSLSSAMIASALFANAIAKTCRSTLTFCQGVVGGTGPRLLPEARAMRSNSAHCTAAFLSNGRTLRNCLRSNTPRVAVVASSARTKNSANAGAGTATNARALWSPAIRCINLARSSCEVSGERSATRTFASKTTTSYLGFSAIPRWGLGVVSTQGQADRPRF